MIVLDSDIVTLLSYGQTDKLQQRIAAVQEREELAVTIITRMEILRGRFDAILKAANEDELLKAMERFRSSRRLLDSFRLLEVNEDAAQRKEEAQKTSRHAHGVHRSGARWAAGYAEHQGLQGHSWSTGRELGGLTKYAMGTCPLSGLPLLT